jgi:hypothetical protein
VEDLVDRMLAADDEEALVTVLDEAKRALADPATTEDEVEQIRLAGELPTMRLEALRLNAA